MPACTQALFPGKLVLTHSFCHSANGLLQPLTVAVAAAVHQIHLVNLVPTEVLLLELRRDVSTRMPLFECLCANILPSRSHSILARHRMHVYVGLP